MPKQKKAEDSAVVERKIQEAIKAGQARNYHKAVDILEPLALEYTLQRPEIMLYLGRAYHSQSNFSLAVSAFHTYLAIKSDDGAGWFFLGRTYLAMASYPKACQCLRQSLEINPDSAEALGLLGTSLLKQKQSAKALKAFEAALNICPDDERLNMGYRNALLVEAVRSYNAGNAKLAAQMFDFLVKNGMSGVMLNLYYGHALQAIGNLKDALICYQEAISLSPDDNSLRWFAVEVLLEMGRADEAAKIIGQPVQNPQELALEMLKQAVFSGKWTNAIENGRLYIKKYGSDYMVHSFMGEAARNLRRYQDALNHFFKAQKLNPEYLAARYGMLMTFLDEEDWESLDKELHKRTQPPLDEDTVMYYAAICNSKLGKQDESILAEVQAVFLKHPSDPVIMGILANLYLAVGLPDLAESWYSRLIKLDDYNEDAFLNLITCYVQMQKWSAAEKAYTKYLKRWDMNHQVRRGFVRLLVQREKWKNAADETEKMLPFARNSDALIHDLAQYRRRAGQFRQAAIHYRTLLLKNPNDKVLMHHFVFCLVKNGMLEQAIHIIQKWHKVNKPDGEGLLIEASLYLQMQEVENALDTLRIAFKNFPKDPRIPAKIAEIYNKTGNTEMASMFSAKEK